MSITVEQIASWMTQHYPPQLAENWDKVGLTVGRNTSQVARVLLAVDPVQPVITEAIEGRYDLLITHHPLYLRGTSFVTDQTSKGRTTLALVESGISLFCAHTNADAAHAGVAQALADLLGVQESRPLIPNAGAPDQGLGRIGHVEPTTLGDFARLTAQRLPSGPHGLFMGGDPSRPVVTVAVSGGAGDSMLQDATDRGADVFVTADLRHHPSQDHLAEEGPALLCGSHWATEVVWLPVLREQLLQAFPDVRIDVSTIVTEPWTAWLQTKGTLQ